MTEDQTADQKRNRIVAYAIIIFIMGAFFGGFFVARASAAHDYYEDRPLIDSNPVHSQAYKTELSYGTVKIMLRCGYNTLSKSVEISNDIRPDLNHTFDINPDGYVEIDLIPGNFTAYLRDGNGGQPETQHFTIAPQKLSYVTFLGHAVAPRQAIKPKITIKPTPTPTPTPQCRWVHGHWENSCDTHHHCHTYWIEGYWDCNRC
jgi:hypothetical protein